MFMLVIEDYNDIKITKVKSYYKVYFSYRGRRFFIRSDYEDEGTFMTLYEKVMLPDGGMKVEMLAYATTSSCTSSLVEPKKGIKSNGYTYSQIDKKVFAMNLERLGFVRLNI